MTAEPHGKPVDDKQDVAGIVQEEEGEDTDKDQGWAWFVVLGCLLSRFIVGGLQRTPGVFYLHLLKYYGQSAEATSFCVGINLALLTMLAPLASALCNRFSARRLTSLGAFLATVGSILSAVSPNLICLYVSFGLILGTGLAFAYCPGVVIVGHYFKKRRSLALGMATSGGPLSGFLSPAMMELLFYNYGYFGTFLILSGLLSHLCICAALYRPLNLHQRISKQNKLKRDHEQARLLPSKDDNDNMGPETCQLDASYTDSEQSSDIRRVQLNQLSLNSEQEQKRPKCLDMSLLDNPPFMCFCIEAFFFSLSWSVIFTYLQALIVEKGIDQIQASYIISFSGICDFSSRIILSILLDVDWIRRFRMHIFNGVIFVIAVVTMAAPFSSMRWQFWIITGLYGLSVAIHNGQKSVILIDLLEIEHLASSYGLMLGFQGPAAIIGPIIGGLVKDYTGSYDVVFYVGSVGMFLGGVLLAAGVWIFRRKNYRGYTNIV